MKMWYNPWDIVLCPMKFSNGIGSKFRPVVILSKDRDDYLICAISTQLQQWWAFDVFIQSDNENHLRSQQSVIRIFKITTITEDFIHKARWKLSQSDWIHLKENMKHFIESW